jgi:predicted GNAT family N-acyltransferase
MAVLPPLRCSGIGRGVLDRLVDAARARGDREVRLDALAGATGFYQRAGFVPHGPVFDHASAAHQLMALSLAR